jgi:hypothetical protein
MQYRVIGVQPTGLTVARALGRCPHVESYPWPKKSVEITKAKLPLICEKAQKGQGTRDKAQGTRDRGQGTGDRGQGTGDTGHGTWDMGHRTTDNE